MGGHLRCDSMHDARILSLCFDTIEDFFDTISMTLRSGSFLEDYGSETIRIVCRGCYRAMTDTNMWIVGMDSIRLGTMQEEVISLGGTHKKQFMHFHAETNTTASVIDIYAESIEAVQAPA